MVFHPLHPLFDLCNLLCGVLMIVLAVIVINKIRKSSKNLFAYLLMSLTACQGVSYVGVAVVDSFRLRVPFADRDYYFTNFPVLETFAYMIAISALQAWVFAVRYQQSATESSLT